jgi:cell division protease FtsH
MNNNTKNILIWVSLILGFILIFNFAQNSNWSENVVNVSISDFLNKIENRQVVSVQIQGRVAQGKLTDGSSFETYVGEYPGLINKLHDNAVDVEVLPPDTKMNSLLSIFISWFPMLLLMGVWIFFMRQVQSGGGKTMGFGRSKAKLVSDKSKVTFNDVAGIDEAKEELTEIVDFLRDPSKFQKLGGKIPKGCLLVGPPGTGKTLLAKAIAGEANVPFFSISGSDFVEMFVGVGASRVRDMFEQGKRNAPCIIFIDEIDAVGRHRGVGLGGGNDEREQTLNQMLVEMDGFESNEGVVIIAATNRPDILDPALLRPGRFDRQINVSNPDIEGREKILRVHLKKVKHNSKIHVRTIAKGTPGFSGAELSNLVNEAALLAARQNKKEVDMEDLEKAKDKVMMGPERRSMIMSDEEKMLTAYHEGGHAIVAIHSPASDPIHKATIIPRGRALGMVMRLPETDRLSLKREKALADLAVAMGGRVAEEIIFGHSKVTSGASSDIKAATALAKAMVTEWGMSDKVGPVFHGSGQEDYYGGGRSQYMAQIIDQEIGSLVEQGSKTAHDILTKYLPQLHIVAKALLDHETLSGQQIKNLIAGRGLDEADALDDAPVAVASKKSSKAKKLPEDDSQ